MTELELVASGGIDPRNLNRSDYANSLAAEALRVGLLTEDDMARIRGDMMNALAEVIGYATAGKSSSVLTSTAEKLAQSLLFNISTCLLAEPTPEKAAALLRDRRMSELYAKGYQINKKRHDEAKRLWARVRYTRLEHGGAEYDKTIDVYFRRYLSSYDARTGAHDKIYLSLPAYGIRGAFHIDGAVRVLEKLAAINAGKRDEGVIEGSQPIPAFYEERKEPNS
ncbi:MAG: hypothetical protein IKQ92_03515 [Clostridia bacterium]|nr:hypothetical protein [Clostridia bacterium]